MLYHSAPASYSGSAVQLQAVRFTNVGSLWDISFNSVTWRQLLGLQLLLTDQKGDGVPSPCK